MSLNNRISIRDTFGARGAVEVGAYPSSSHGSRSETTADFLLLESKQQKQIMKHPQTEVKVVSERAISESRDLRFTDYLTPCAFHSAADIA